MPAHSSCVAPFLFEDLVPFTQMPLRNDTVEDEGIALHELLGPLARGEDRHRAFTLRIAERTDEQQLAPRVELVEPRLVRREVRRRLGCDVRSGFVEHDVSHLRFPSSAFFLNDCSAASQNESRYRRTSSIFFRSIS